VSADKKGPHTATVWGQSVKKAANRQNATKYIGYTKSLLPWEKVAKIFDF